MKAKLFSVHVFPFGVDLALLFFRVVCGIAFILHGTGKIQDPFHWMGPDAAVPAVLQGLAALAEFGGGLALLLGLLTRLAAFGLVCTMIVASSMHAFVLGDPFVAKGGGRSYELALVYLAMALLFLAAGPGRFSVDRFLFGRR